MKDRAAGIHVCTLPCSCHQKWSNRVLTNDTGERMEDGQAHTASYHLVTALCLCGETVLLKGGAPRGREDWAHRKHPFSSSTRQQAVACTTVCSQKFSGYSETSQRADRHGSGARLTGTVLIWARARPSGFNAQPLKYKDTG